MSREDGETGRVEFVEDHVPLEGIDETLSDLVELYGGEIRESTAGRVEFVLPLRRSVAASGAIACALTWSEEGDDEGVIRIFADPEPGYSRLQRVAILVAGATGAFLWILWPFFPALAPLAMIGGVIAFATWFLTLRGTGGGVAADFLQRLVVSQRDRDREESTVE